MITVILNREGENHMVRGFERFRMHPWSTSRSPPIELRKKAAGIGVAVTEPRIGTVCLRYQWLGINVDRALVEVHDDSMHSVHCARSKVPVFVFPTCTVLIWSGACLSSKNRIWTRLMTMPRSCMFWR